MNFTPQPESPSSISSIESPFTIKSPQRCQRYLPPLQEGRASTEYEERRINMYPSTVHTDISSMVPRCTTTDLDLQDALDSPTEETWVLNHQKLRCLGCMWSPSDTRRTGNPELDNKSDFFFVKKYGKGHLPTNMYLVLCSECMYGGAWTSFPTNEPHFIKYGTLAWKLAPKAPSILQGQKLRPIKPAGVQDLKPEAKETSPDKRRKFSSSDRSPLSCIENKPVKTDSNQERLIIQHNP
jgi:hypothetical protein